MIEAARTTRLVAAIKGLTVRKRETVARAARICFCRIRFRYFSRPCALIQCQMPPTDRLMIILQALAGYGSAPDRL